MVFVVQVTCQLHLKHVTRLLRLTHPQPGTLNPDKSDTSDTSDTTTVCVQVTALREKVADSAAAAKASEVTPPLECLEHFGSPLKTPILEC